MTSKEFVIWLKGFTEGVHDFNITPKQWDLLKERLSEVYNDEEFEETPGMFKDHTLQSYPPYWDHRSPFYTTSGTSGSIDIGRSAVSVWTTGSASSISYTVTTGSGWIGSGVTYTYPNGSTVTYTTGDTNGSWVIKDFSPIDTLDVVDTSNDKTLLHD
jgi:hypothetical protein